MLGFSNMIRRGCTDCDESLPLCRRLLCLSKEEIGRTLLLELPSRYGSHGNSVRYTVGLPRKTFGITRYEHGWVRTVPTFRQLFVTTMILGTDSNSGPREWMIYTLESVWWIEGRRNQSSLQLSFWSFLLKKTSNLFNYVLHKFYPRLYLTSFIISNKRCVIRTL